MSQITLHPFMGSVNNDAPYLNVVLKLNHMSVVSDEIQGIRNMQSPLDLLKVLVFNQELVLFLFSQYQDYV